MYIFMKSLLVVNPTYALMSACKFGLNFLVIKFDMNAAVLSAFPHSFILMIFLKVDSVSSIWNFKYGNLLLATLKKQHLKAAYAN